MLLDFFATGAGIYLLAISLGVAVSLMLNSRSALSWCGGIIVTLTFSVVAAVQPSPVPVAVPLYAVSVGIGSVVVNTGRYSNSPLLASEPYWKKLLLTMAHPRRIRQAARHATKPSDSAPDAERFE